MNVRHTAESFDIRSGPWDLLPFRFQRMAPERVLVTNLVGEHVVLTSRDFDDLLASRLASEPVLRELAGKHIIRAAGDDLALELLALKVRTRHRRLPESTGLHLFVVTLRCEHACPYCQVSRRNSHDERFDMSTETARRAIELMFRSPSQNLKVEFQGGEPLLNFDLVKTIVAEVERANERHGRCLAFVIATNLALLDDDVLTFCRAHDIHLSVSLDGPEDLHNANRPRPGGDSWQRTVDGIKRIKEELGPTRVSAVMTTTQASLGRAREIVDAYVAQGLTEVFLRPISPYGHAVKTRSRYDLDDWLKFYEDGLDYILELNAAGVPIVEHFAAIILKKMLTNEDPGYVDLTSPAGIGIGALVYNYDGDVYASDEGRMLAEMGDRSFRLGNLAENSYEEIMTSDALLGPLEESFAGSAPMCVDCAFEPYCGADPVFHHTTMGDSLGRKAESEFCRRNMGVFTLLLDRYSSSSRARELFRTWAFR